MAIVTLKLPNVKQKNRGTSERMSVLPGRDLPALGAREETCKRHTSEEREGVSLSLL